VKVGQLTQTLPLGNVIAPLEVSHGPVYVVNPLGADERELADNDCRLAIGSDVHGWSEVGTFVQWYR
jgi:hypothetical protein